MLTVSNLALGYDGKKIADLPALHLAKGAECLITGNSGSGKTTLLYTIAGLMKPLGGQIVINGTDITTLSEAARDRFRGQHLGIIFQTLHLVKSLSVLSNILLSSYAAGVAQDKKHALSILEQLGLLDKKDVFPAALSQGQAQRVAIARALLLRPSLILADEPTSSLDDHHTETVITLIKQVAKETGATLLISTHDSRVKAHFPHIVHMEAAA
jgi:putative ABC transport system ATP-binding protein